MDMKILKCEKRLCTCCMEEHEVKTVLVNEQAKFKNVDVNYDACYLYCDAAEELYMNEEQMRDNDMRLKDAYRRKEGLLTSSEISTIRGKYGISQADFCVLLGWGGKTITRYEGHQVQDKAHDTILKKIDNDAEWFIMLLNESKSSFAPETYAKYLATAATRYENAQDVYLRKVIEASYANFHDKPIFQGNTELSLDKVVDMIRYFAATNEVTNLYKVKLMKLMWYADALSYKNRGKSITGLVYQSMPMGALPIGHNSIINLKGVPCEEIDMEETTAYYFHLEDGNIFPSLSEEELEILDIVIEKLGKMIKNQIVSFMHSEQAYLETEPKDMISFIHAEYLQI